MVKMKKMKIRLNEIRSDFCDKMNEKFDSLSHEQQKIFMSKWTCIGFVAAIVSILVTKIFSIDLCIPMFGIIAVLFLLEGFKVSNYATDGYKYKYVAMAYNGFLSGCMYVYIVVILIGILYFALR